MPQEAEEPGRGPSEEASEAKRRRRQSKWGPEAEAGGGPGAGGGTFEPFATPALAIGPLSPTVMAVLQQQESAAHFRRLAAAAAARQMDLPRPRAYVGNLDPWVSEQEIMQIFSAFGTVTGIDMPREGMPPRSKGFCFVEFVEQKMADRAIAALQDFVLGGRMMRVGQPTRQKRPTPMGIPSMPLAAALAVAAGTVMGSYLGAPPMFGSPPAQGMAGQPSGGGAGEASRGAAVLAAEGDTSSLFERRRVAVSGVPCDFEVKDIRTIFQAFGMIVKCEMCASIAQPTVHCGTGVVEFATEHAATTALQAMQGFVLGGSALGLCRGTPPSGSSGGEPAQPMQASGASAREVGTSAQMEASRRANSCSGAAAGPPDAVRVLVLENLVRPGEADEDLADEVREECGRFGELEKVKVHEVGPKRRVRVFARFKDPEAGGRAAAALNGRWFGGRQVKALPYSEEAFARGDLERSAG